MGERPFSAYLDQMFESGEKEMAVFASGMLALVCALDRITDKLELIQNELYLIKMRTHD